MRIQSIFWSLLPNRFDKPIPASLINSRGNPMESNMIPVLRPASRIVLLDPDDRVLLINFVDADRNVSWWATPGGGLNKEETHEQAACRELIEETGLRDFHLGPWIWSRSHVFASNGITYDQQERFFFVRTSAFISRCF